MHMHSSRPFTIERQHGDDMVRVQYLTALRNVRGKAYQHFLQ